MLIKMPLTIPDDILNSTGLDENAARLEIACRLFDAERLSLWNAAKWVGMTRVQFESELLNRGIAIYRPSVDDLAGDLDAMKQIGV